MLRGRRRLLKPETMPNLISSHLFCRMIGTYLFVLKSAGIPIAIIIAG